MKKALLLFVLKMFPVLAWSQFEVTYFELTQTGKSVELSWQIKEGSTCNGIRILRSTDSVNFTQIGEVQGICGSTTIPQAFDFTDESPVNNTRNYYKLEFGLGEYWLVKSVSFIFVEHGFFEMENPAQFTSPLFFKTEAKLTLRIITTNGQVLFSTQILKSAYTLGELFSSFPSGLFFIEVADEKGNRQFAKIVGLR